MRNGCPFAPDSCVVPEGTDDFVILHFSNQECSQVFSVRLQVVNGKSQQTSFDSFFVTVITDLLELMHYPSTIRCRVQKNSDRTPVENSMSAFQFCFPLSKAGPCPIYTHDPRTRF
jgi:hypothetical protein